MTRGIARLPTPSLNYAIAAIREPDTKSPTAVRTMAQFMKCFMAAACLAVVTVYEVSGQTVLWQCNSFPQNSPLNGCNWVRQGNTYGENNIASVVDPSGGTDRVLRVFYPNGSWTNGEQRGGCRFKAKPFDKMNNALLQYDVYFSSNFDFVKGGKLPGFSGGSGNCVGGLHDLTCFTTRFKFDDGGKGALYSYIPNENRTDFCDDDYVSCNFNYGHSLGLGKWIFTPGQWYTIAQRINLNRPGDSNGKIKIYINGQNVYTLTDLTFRTSYKLKIDTLLFTTFFGGNTADWASTDDVYTYFKNFKITK